MNRSTEPRFRAGCVTDGRVPYRSRPSYRRDYPHFMREKVEAQKAKPHSLKVAELRSSSWVFSSKTCSRVRVFFKRRLATSDDTASTPGRPSPGRLTKTLPWPQGPLTSSLGRGWT